MSLLFTFAFFPRFNIEEALSRKSEVLAIIPKDTGKEGNFEGSESDLLFSSVCLSSWVLVMQRDFSDIETSTIYIKN